MTEWTKEERKLAIEQAIIWICLGDERDDWKKLDGWTRTCLIEILCQRNRALAALKKIVEMNRQTAKDQYGDADKFESAAFICWCVCRDEEKRCKQ